MQTAVLPGTERRLMHINIVTGQPQANLIPLLFFKPDRVALVVTHGMMEQDKGRSFAQILKKVEVIADGAVEQFEFPDRDYRRMEEEACTILVDLLDRYPDHDIVLNATGGTKLISQAWVKAIEMDEQRCSAFYLDTDHNRLEWLQPQQPANEIPDVLTVEHAVKAQGFTKRKTDSDNLDWVKKAESRQALTIWLGQNAVALDRLIGEINWGLASFDTKKHPGEAVVLKTCDLRNGPIGDALKLMGQQGLIDLAEDAAQATFYVKDESSLIYLKGGWMEEYVWLRLRGAGVREVCCGMDQTHDIKRSSDLRNELDAVAVHRNHVLVIECKTANLTQESEFNRVLQKLDSIGNNTGGSLGQKWLVLGRIPISGRDTEEREKSVERMDLRAKSMNIKLIKPSDLPALKNIITSWMRQEPFHDDAAL